MGKHLGFVALAWAVFFVLAAWVLPPLDSHQRPVPLVYWSVLTLTILLILAHVGCSTVGMQQAGTMTPVSPSQVP